MTSDGLDAVFEMANALQDELDSIGLPPPETTPSHSHSVINIALVRRTRGYIEKVAHQVNKSYDDACYDACAVMLRRLVEMLIIEAFEAHKIADHIKVNGDFMQLGGLIDQALKETDWNIGRNAKRELQRLSALKEVGDRSAHDRRYNAHRRDIDNVKRDVRGVVQELLALANLK